VYYFGQHWRIPSNSPHNRLSTTYQLHGPWIRSSHVG
ncbi:hypothetical protein A2U01_0079545, partial [Trifolium medium]|nr:hypothetical protein [Trifolium medium]